MPKSARTYNRFARSQLAARTIGIGADDIAWTLNDRIPFLLVEDLQERMRARLASAIR
jgi:hypothetical protein